MEIEELVAKVNQFRDARDWRQYHNEKDLAISISLEANELLELFQWQDSTKVVQTKQERLKEELADVLIYSLMMADNLQFDVGQIIEEKLAKNAQKYPVEKARAQIKNILNSKKVLNRCVYCDSGLLIIMDRLQMDVV